MLPNTTVIIERDGTSRIEGEEKSPNCFKLSELGKRAGKVSEDNEKDHNPPVQQTIHQKN